jgi:pyridoxal phosphate enzyme (YggS family)
MMLPMPPTDLARNISEVARRIRSAETAAGRRKNSVSLLAVSKTKSPELIRTAYACGQTAFGENYAQEMVDKAQLLTDLPLLWHFIGPIQSNKTASIAALCDWAHSVDRLKIARRLSEQRPPDLNPLNVLIQVNISGEHSKSGVRPEEVADLAHGIRALPGLSLRGLMAIPAPAGPNESPRPAFRALRELKDSLALTIPGLDTLSMGMSADLEDAIAEGANLVRVGTDIFGARYN